MITAPSFSGINVIKTKIDSGLIQSLPGIYKMLGEGGNVLYVGKAKNLLNRLKSYTVYESLTIKTKRLLSLVVNIEVIITKSEAEALLLEASLIKALFPKYNILLKDDKSLPYITISKSDEYPKIFRFRGKKNKEDAFFGPFGTGEITYQMIDLITKLFMVRTCSDAEFKSRKRPCLKHQIKLCSAPCTGLISKQDYNLKIKDAIAFLSGKSLEVKNALIKQMNQLSDELKFEEAIATRNKIELITKIQGKGEVNFTEYKNTDVVCIHRVAETVGVQVFFLRDGMSFGSKVFFPSVRSIVSDNIEDISLSEVLEAFLMQFYCENQVPEEILLNHEITNIKNIEIAISNTKILTPKKGLKLDLVNFTLTNLLNQIEKELLAKAKTSENLHKLKETFNLPKIPQKIEVFDNSHISGSNFIGAMIVAGPEGFIKKEYRKYNAKFDTTKAGDDYAMMAEVMKRRYKSAPAETLPDLILIDGGIGQLSVVKKTFDEIGITVPFICISKGPNRNAGEEKFHTPLGLTNFSLPKNSSLLFYLQNLRDEVHRFAIGTYRKRHQKSFLSSSIDDIKGIGKARKKALLNHFGSFELIKKAKPEDLMKVSGISKEIAMQMSEINK